MWHEHGCREYTEHAKMAAVSHGISHVTTKLHCKHTTLVDIKNYTIKKPATHSDSHNEPAWERRIALRKSNQQQPLYSCRGDWPLYGSCGVRSCRWTRQQRDVGATRLRHQQLWRSIGIAIHRHCTNLQPKTFYTTRKEMHTCNTELTGYRGLIPVANQTLMSWTANSFHYEA